MSQLVQLSGIAVDLSDPEIGTAEVIVKMARIVLDQLGKDVSHNRTVYYDGTVMIEYTAHDDRLEITRMPMPSLDMPGPNPVIMVRDDDIYRRHGEQRYIVDHLRRDVLV